MSLRASAHIGVAIRYTFCVHTDCCRIIKGEEKMKQLILGNEAVARGLYEAGCMFVSSYPGTPSTEITEAVAK